jgi:hypothetical protein
LTALKERKNTRELATVVILKSYAPFMTLHSE